MCVVAKQLHWQAELQKVLQPHGISYFLGKAALIFHHSMKIFSLLLMMCSKLFFLLRLDLAAHYAMVNWDICAGTMSTPKEPVQHRHCLKAGKQLLASSICYSRCKLIFFIQLIFPLLSLECKVWMFFILLQAVCTLLAMLATLPVAQLFFFHILLIKKVVTNARVHAKSLLSN